jgi:hypothetical protein
METPAIDRTESLRAFPTLSAAAEMIGIATSTLTRRADCHPLPRGARDQVLPPAEVLRLAAVYRKRSLNEVAADLIDLAGRTGDEDAARVEDAVDAFFAGRVQTDSATEFLAQAKRYLPQALYAEVEKTLSKGEGRQPAAIVGHVPDRPAPASASIPARSARPSAAQRDDKPSRSRRRGRSAAKR